MKGFLAVYFAGEAPPTTAQALAGYELQSGSPSSIAKYRNVHYAILGEIVTRVSGLKYRDYVTTRILAPLGSDAAFDAANVDNSRLSVGYVSRWDPTRLLFRVVMPSAARRVYRGQSTQGLMALNEYNLSTSSIGGLLGSMDSFSPFIRSQMTDGSPLLSEETTRLMQTPSAQGKVGVVSQDGVCLGWKLGIAGERRFLNHEGSGLGFTSELRLYPAEGLGMIVLMNKSSIAKTMRVAHEICERICEHRHLLQQTPSEVS